MDGRKNSAKGDWIKKIALTEEDVMLLFEISKATIARLRRNQEIPYTKIGGSYFYLPKAIKKMLKDRMVKPKPPNSPE